ncbi:MAG: hypothetical protein ACOZAA_14400 [Pseudomonadota bacterium]
MGYDTLDERLRFDIGFLIGRISKSELKALSGRDCTEQDRVRYQIGERIAKRLREGYRIECLDRKPPLHSTSFGAPEKAE